MRRLLTRLHAARVTVRPMTARDGDALDRVFAGLSPTSRRSRYLAELDQLAPAVRSALLDIDGRHHVAFVAEVGRGHAPTPVGIGRYVLDEAGSAEIAYEVVDAWHGRGVGRRLVRALVAAARSAGVERMHASLLDDNVASMGLLRHELVAVRVRRDGGLLHVTASLSPAPLEVGEVLADLGLHGRLATA